MAQNSRRRRGRTHRSNGRNNSYSTIYHDAIGLMSTLLKDRQRSGAEKISLLADSARRLGAEMEDMPHVTSYMDMGADRLDELADYVTETPLEDMIADGAGFARRNPIVTLGVAVAAGYYVTQMGAISGLTNGKTATRTNAGRRRRAATASQRSAHA